jgi:hypothetical protein
LFKAKVLAGKHGMVGREFNVKIDDCIYFMGGGQSGFIAQEHWDGNIYTARTTDGDFMLERI